MELNKFLKNYFNQLSCKNISDKNNFDDYDNFKQFIMEHYQLNHVELFNYIKYVKIKRQIIKLKDGLLYNKHINDINSIIKEMYEEKIFLDINIKKYLFKINVLFTILDDKKISYLKIINTLRNLLELNKDHIFKFKIISNINALLYKYKLFLKKSKLLINKINKFLDFEKSYGIDHNMIKLNNTERCVLGKKSEYFANKIMNSYINYINEKLVDKKYYYETNINFLKFLGIPAYHEYNIKGEVDGMIISYDGNIYLIEKIIEVKSSIKSTFEDIKKFKLLQDYINQLSFDNNIVYNNFVFTRDSFKNIINKHLTDWIIYLCVNNIYRDNIEKSHLYFSHVLKIVDDHFIKDFYVNNDEEQIKEKFNIILNNRDYIENLFENWKNDIKLDTDNCNIFISKIL